jgi:MGT family glycosyltransferase
VDMNNEYAGLRDFFAGRLARSRAEDILKLAESFQPNLLICDEIDFGAMLAAEKCGIPYASVVVIAAGGFARKALLSENLNKLRAELGLAPDPELAFLSRYLVLSPVPPSYRDPSDPLPATAHFFRPTQPAAKAGDWAWLEQLDKAKTVYFTLGTIFNRESGDLFARVLEALKPLPLEVVMTLGPHIDPAEFGAVPPHIHIAQYIPQALLLPHCALVISHAGSGSLMGALEEGLPSLLLPMGADQPLNAARSVALGFALALDVMTATPTEIQQGVLRLLHENSFRQAAAVLQSEIAAMPPIAEAIAQLEKLS